jgi:hypothetical protein
MRTKRIEATQQVATQLFEAEAAIDAAIAATAKLTALMPEARANASISAVVGQEAMLQASQTLAALVAARQDIVNTHKALDEVKTDLGLRTMAMGGAVYKGSATPHLEVVAEAA